MKQLFLLFFISSFLFYSCEKEAGTNDSSDIQYLDQIGSSKDCGSCSQISVKIEPGPETNGCCTSDLIIKAKNPCGHRVVINGDTIGQVNEPFSGFSIVTCPGEKTVVQIFGRDAKNGRWNSLCFTQDIDCNGCTCDETRLGIIKLDEEQGCCTYEINASATPDSTNACLYQLNIGNQAYPLEQGSINQQVTVCNDPLDVNITVNGKVCKEKTLECSCCDGVTYDINSLGQLPNGCCSYVANIYNDDQCELFLYDEKYNVINSIPIRSSISENLEVCAINSSSQLFYIGSDPDNICEEIELYAQCSNLDCCAEVTMEVSQLGQNDKNCCEYQFEITNGSSCKQIFFNEIGYAKVIEPGQTIIEVIEFCFSTQSGLFQDYYLGPENNPKTACKKERISLVCN